MLSAPQYAQSEVERYTINQLNNVLALAFHFVDFTTPLLFKTDPSEKLVSSFKEEMLPYLNDIVLTNDTLKSSRFIYSAFNDMRLEVNSAPFINSDNQTSYEFMLSFSLWVAKQEGFDMSYLMTALVKQVFMHCDLLDYAVDHYRVSLDLRASVVREQFHQLVLNNFARTLDFESDPDIPMKIREKLFEKDSLPAIYAEWCFIAIIAELTQSKHFDLANALHNMFYFAKIYSISESDLNLNERQLAAVYTPCFLKAFGLHDNIYTKKNGFSEEECEQIDKQWKLMSVILTHALSMDDFKLPYHVQREYYESLRLPFLLKKNSDMPDIPSVFGMLSKAEKLESVIALLRPIDNSLLKHNMGDHALAIDKKQPSGIFGRFRGRKRSKGSLEVQLSPTPNEKQAPSKREPQAQQVIENKKRSKGDLELLLSTDPNMVRAQQNYYPLYHLHNAQSTSSCDDTKDTKDSIRSTRFPIFSSANRRASIETKIWSSSKQEESQSEGGDGDSHSACYEGKGGKCVKDPHEPRMKRIKSRVLQGLK